MPNLHGIQQEVRTGHKAVRVRYAQHLNKITGRNIITYYSGWLQKPKTPGMEVNDLDTNALMSVIHGLERKKGLDLVLHTPGGGVAATESIVSYLRDMFGTDIRVIVPHLAMSAGTMIACAAKTIIMGKHSSLGPIDPQIGGISAHGVVLEFERAYNEIKDAKGSKKIAAKKAVWIPIIAKYPQTFVGECEQWIVWADEMAREWLETGMFEGIKNAKQKAKKIVDILNDHSHTKSHSRHLSAAYCKKIGLSVEAMEKDQKLQDEILSLHHVCMLTFMETNAVKIIENHQGVSFLQPAKN